MGTTISKHVTIINKEQSVSESINLSHIKQSAIVHEMASIKYKTTVIPNPKNLWIRGLLLSRHVSLFFANLLADSAGEAVAEVLQPLYYKTGSFKYIAMYLNDQYA